jgi:hypothetical protein
MVGKLQFIILKFEQIGGGILQITDFLPVDIIKKAYKE